MTDTMCTGFDGRTTLTTRIIHVPHGDDYNGDDPKTYWQAVQLEGRDISPPNCFCVYLSADQAVTLAHRLLTLAHQAGVEISE